MKSRTSLWLELGMLLASYYLLLQKDFLWYNWSQLVSLWLVFYILYFLTKRRNFSTGGLLIVSFFAGLSWLLIFRIDSELAFKHWSSWLIAVLAYLIAANLNWRNLKYKYFYGFSAIGLLVITSIFGDQIGGARAWLTIAGIRFQPIEIARIFILLFLAGFFHENRQLLTISKQPTLQYWGPVFILMAGALLFLAAQRDLGPALLFYFHFVALVLFTAFSWQTLVFYGIITGVGFLAAWTQFSHFSQRVAVWLNPWIAAEGAGYQILQGLFAINSGALFGRGFGKGYLQAIPAVHTDYIFALIGEELGLFGAILILLLYFSLLIWGLKIAQRLKGSSYILACEIVLLWGLQIFIVIGGLVRVLPLTGMTLPFISFGGSSLLANMWLLGMLTSLSKDDQETHTKQPVLKIGIFLLILFIILAAFLFYWQVFRTDLANHPYNPRAYFRFQQERGTIFDCNGNALASTQFDGEQFYRQYSSVSSLSHITGYFHQRYGITGLERAYNGYLENKQNLYLTIDLGLQKQVEQLLEGYHGAIIVMHAKSGALLAVVSAPAINSNLLNDLWSDYQDDPNSPFFNRALHGTYPPGSVTKPLLLAAAYQEQIASPERTWLDQGSINYDGQVIRNYNSRVHGLINSQEALANSSNTVFAELAVELQDTMLEYYQHFGLGESWSLGLGSTTGNLPLGKSFNRFGWGQLGIGQGEILVTPLQMAVAISTIANGGERVNPYLVQRIDGNLFTRRIYRPSIHSKVITQKVAAQVRAAMIYAVEQGTAQAAQIPGVEVAGKTGTAETARGLDHSWFVGFLPEHELSIVVVIEHGGAGSTRAAPLGQKVFAAILEDMEERLIP